MRTLAPRLRHFLGDYASPRRGAVAAALLLVLLGGLVEGVGVLLLVPILMIVTGEATSAIAAWLPADPDLRLGLLLGAFAVLVLMRAVILHARDVRLARLNVAFVNGLRSATLAALAAGRWERLASLPHGRMTHLATGDVISAGAAAQSLTQAVAAAMVLAAQLAVALILAPLFALVSIALMALIVLAVRPLLRRAEAAGVALRTASSGLAADLLQLLAGLKMTRAQGQQDAWLQSLADRQQAVGQSQVAFASQRSISGTLFTTIAAFAGGAALLVGHAFLGVAPAVLVVMLLVLARIAGPALQVQQSAQLFMHHLPAYEALRAVTRELGAPQSPLPREAAPLPSAAPITFDRVSYRHPRTGQETAPAGLDGLSLTLFPGSLVGVTGPSGAGKTTLVDLLAGLIAPQDGEIRVGGALLDAAHLAAWRRRLAYVGQDAALFHDSLRANLLWGAAPGTDDEAIERALATAGADQLVARIGLDTMAGERGSLLSGGERQRLALARALLRRPGLLILDEATNAVDEAAERAIIARLAALSPRPTILLVSHRRANLDLCDRIVRIEAGRLVEDSLQPVLKAVP